jgi:hypothetical protein
MGFPLVLKYNPCCPALCYYPSKHRRGIYIDYLLPNNEDWITLLSNPNQKKFQLTLSEQEYQETIQKELEILKLTEIINILIRSV